jgi:site-specific DNA-methyltransferase (adenine-specific)
MRVKFVATRDTPIGDLKPHPNNPNRGSVQDIAASLREFGQYRSVVANKDLTILAGHHVVEAAKELGMKTVRVDVIDTDEQTAQKILLADNRLADLGMGPDLEMLLKNLEDLQGDFEGTGFDEEYLRLLTEAVTGPEDKGGIGEGDGPGGGGGLRRVTLLLDSRLADHWDAHRKMFPDDTSAFEYLLG